MKIFRFDFIAFRNDFYVLLKVFICGRALFFGVDNAQHIYVGAVNYKQFHIISEVTLLCAINNIKCAVYKKRRLNPSFYRNDFFYFFRPFSDYFYFCRMKRSRDCSMPRILPTADP